MKIEGAGGPKAFVVNVAGRLDVASAPEFDQKCGRWLDQGEKNMVLDLSALEYISSIGLRSILLLGKRIKGQGGKLHLCCLNRTIMKVFQMSGFTAIFPVFDTLGTAIESI